MNSPFRPAPRLLAPSRRRCARICVVSIIVPVFNECATFQAMMDALLAKQLPDMRKEIIVVESNSTDGSRELVQSYEGVRVSGSCCNRGRAEKAMRCARVWRWRPAISS